MYAVLSSSTAPHVWARGTRFKPILELMLMMMGSTGIVFEPVTKCRNCRRLSLSLSVQATDVVLKPEKDAALLVCEEILILLCPQASYNLAWCGQQSDAQGFQPHLTQPVPERCRPQFRCSSHHMIHKYGNICIIQHCYTYQQSQLHQ